jgi:hypothetical protein
LDAKSDATSAAEWTKEAHILREIASRLYLARASARRAPPADIAALNKRLKRYTVRPELSPSDLGYKRKVASGVVSLAQPIARLADLIAELATSPDFKHIRMCEGLECGWFFLDRSPATTADGVQWRLRNRRGPRLTTNAGSLPARAKFEVASETLNPQASQQFRLRCNYKLSEILYQVL